MTKNEEKVLTKFKNQLSKTEGSLYELEENLREMLDDIDDVLDELDTPTPYKKGSLAWKLTRVYDEASDLADRVESARTEVNF